MPGANLRAPPAKPEDGLSSTPDRGSKKNDKQLSLLPKHGTSTKDT
jgi:hypothetical protein